ncbi:Glutathione S-transferase 3 [Leucoagaricus sp. SymC.cos]|nr:Glutathione S-transferase 3 [Leucoagaricus sp. SymC.cos]
MVLKLYGFPLSSAVRIATTVLHEKQIPFEYINVDLLTYENKKAEYLAIQPFGQVPCIDDDGFILYEGRAISRYLDETYSDNGPKLIPLDPKKRALFEQAASSEAFNFDRYGTPLAFELFFKKLRGREPDIAKVEELKTILAAKLDVYDQILSKQRYLVGDVRDIQ